ncbi:putative oxidoreductase YusZ [Cytospora mali]|uniref:Oxidoreductase YusZ n=1 Tax=Cytospora mali TaxID=578113 RepID=A0A194USP4_CYTMA|nr:putative oxidoreductase YusZ [Valsa mali var. pyri (nom. inval.)]
MTQTSTSPQTWLITGCSSGFGELFVHQLRALGDNVIATGRNAETKLAHLKDTGAAILDLDVSGPEAEIQSKMDEAWKLYPGGIDVVVNNAGYILSAAFEELTQQDLETCFKTNFHGPLNITRALLPKLRAKGTGSLVYMSSQAAWHTDPSATGYCSSKFALEGAVECLSKELAIFAPGIKVLIVEPGYFGTRAFSNISHVTPSVDAYAQFNAGVRAYEEGLVGKEPGDPAKAVERVIELTKGTGMAAGKAVPLRVQLGTDGWSRIKAKCEETLKICNDWEELAKSTERS